MAHRDSKFYERTLVLLKPEVVQRGLIGNILTRLENKGLKIIAMKMVWPSEDKASEHYDWSEAEQIATGDRTIEARRQKGLPTDKTNIEYAQDVQKRLRSHISAGPIIAMVIAGAHAVDHVRKVRGTANSLQADIGSITADLTVDSYAIADEDNRANRSLVHASSSLDEADREIKIWFKETEILEYDLAIEMILYGKEWEDFNQQYNPNKKSKK